MFSYDKDPIHNGWLWPEPKKSGNDSSSGVGDNESPESEQEQEAEEESSVYRINWQAVLRDRKQRRITAYLKDYTGPEETYPQSPELGSYEGPGGFSTRSGRRYRMVKGAK